MSFNPLLIWFLIGLGLVLSEFMLPGIILVFFGLGAWTASITSWLGLTTGWTSQLLVFTISSILYLVLLRRWFKVWFTGFEGGQQNPKNNIDGFSGQIVTVTESIDPETGSGKVEFKGAAWSARCTVPLAASQRARIVGVDSITLIVEPE